MVYESDKIVLNLNDSIQIADGYWPGDMTRPGFISDYFDGPDDSIVVIFDDTFRMVHYANTPDQLAEIYYLFESLRNIGNASGYEFSRYKKKKEAYTNVHKYYFTEQDYLDAKD